MTDAPATTERYHHGDLPAALRAATADLVAERGPHAFSLREVARRAGVSHAAPAHHFGSAQGLLTAVATEGFTHLARALADAAVDIADPADRLRACGRAYVRTALAHPGHYAVMFAHDLCDQDDADLAEAGIAAYGQLLLTIEYIRDQLQPDLDVETAATMAWSTMSGLVVLAPVLPDVAAKNDLEGHPLDHLIRRFADILLAGFIGTT